MSSFVQDETGLWIEKFPNTNLAYVLGFSGWLKGDTLTSADFTVPDGLTNGGEGIDTGAKTAWIRLAGGTPGRSYRVICHVVSGGGDQEDFAFTVKVVKP